jgi:hypothetical protein
LIHSERDFHLRRGITDEANDFQGVKDIRVLIFAIHHHLSMGLMVWRQDPYRGPEQQHRKDKVPSHQSESLHIKKNSVKSITSQLEFTQILNYHVEALLETLTMTSLNIKCYQYLNDDASLVLKRNEKSPQKPLNKYAT